MLSKVYTSTDIIQILNCLSISIYILCFNHVHKKSLKKYIIKTYRWHIDYRFCGTIEKFHSTIKARHNYRVQRKRFKALTPIIIPRKKSSGKNKEHFTKLDTRDKDAKKRLEGTRKDSQREKEMEERPRNF